MLTRLTNENKIYRDFGQKPKKEEVFHTSGYGMAQSGDKIGAAGDGLDVAKRKAIEEQRKYVRGYNNARIMSGLYRTQRIAEMTPRMAGGRGSLVGDDGSVNIETLRNASDSGTSGSGTSASGTNTSGAGKVGGGLRSDRGGSQGDKGSRVVGLRGDDSGGKGGARGGDPGGGLSRSGSSGSSGGLSGGPSGGLSGGVSGGPKPNVSRKPTGPRMR